MKLEFIDTIPEGFTDAPVLISGASSTQLKQKQYLSLNDDGNVITIYEIRYEYRSSPFKQTELFSTIIAVGHEAHFYLFDIAKNTNIIALKLSGYFGHAYLDKEHIYIADANGIFCLGRDGCILWSNNKLGIDGVVIHEITDSEIVGSGEWDPPDGWEDFVIDKQTGTNKIEKRDANTM
jgi:hypothetical protein